MPKRIQRKRTKGWRMPPNTIYVGRPSKWGNPFRVGGHFKLGGDAAFGSFKALMVWCESAAGGPGFTLIENNAMAVDWFRELCRRGDGPDVSELRGKDIADWCSLDEPCHGDVLLEIANR